MCGRARCTLSRECVVREAGAASDEFINGNKYSPVENMAPGRYTPVVYPANASLDADADEKPTPAMRVEAMRWGLVPSFTKPHAKPDHFVMFNARSDSLRERPAFRRLLESRRCVVLCDGYYEWQQVDKKEKQPYYCYRLGHVVKLAGLYDTWTSSDGTETRSFTILTTDAAPQLQWLHTRMPVVLTDDGAARWTSNAPFATLTDLFAPSACADDIAWHPVDKRLGSTKFQSPDCAKKVDIKHAGDITAFFSRAKTEPSAVKHEVSAEPQPATAVKTETQQSPVKTERVESETTSTERSVDVQSPKQTELDPEHAGRDKEPRSKRAMPSDGFVRASTLLGKRNAPPALSLPPPKQQQQQTRASWSSPTRASPSKQRKTKPAATTTPTRGSADKKQSSLLTFLQPK